MGAKPDNLVAYYLTLAHYYLLTRKPDEAVKIMVSRIKRSAILQGKQTACYYEIKYYYKYLQFLLSMMNVGTKLENSQQYKNLIEDETSLSLIEDCYTSAFSVARFYMQNSVEPSRTLGAHLIGHKKASSSNDPSIASTDPPTTAAPPPEPPQTEVFLGIGNSECYRILSECLDLMHVICKYYIDISRYRDATGYIREALDITQLNFSTRRIASFLLTQISADLIATCLNEACTRIKICENLCLGVKEIELGKKKQPKLDSSLLFMFANDIFKFKNFATLTNLRVLKDIKTIETAKGEAVLNLNEEFTNVVSLIKQYLNENKTLEDFAKDQFVQLVFNVCSHLLKPDKTVKKEIAAG
jgi:hypothetical protein